MEPMRYLSPTTMTQEELRALLDVSASHPRDHLVFSLALGTGLRLAEIVGLDCGDVSVVAGDSPMRSFRQLTTS